MKAIDVFRKHKGEMVRLWTDSVFDTYPFETTGFLRTKDDPFGNPVANMTKEAAGALYDAVTGETVEVAHTKKAMDRFIKLRAVQTFSPSQSMAVFSLMKPILREHVMPELVAQGDLAARAFDLQKTLNALCVIVMRKGLLQSFACILHELGMHDRVFRAPAPQYDAAFAKDFFAEARPLVEKLVSVL